jgi:hypothetical protein
MGKRLDLKQFIEICKLKHDGKYDYSKIKEYINNKTYYTIRCIEHDYTFDIRGDMHLQGQGCRKCKKNKLSNLRKNILDDVILLFRKKHGDKYDYSLIKEYISCDLKVSIICKKHGIFNQSSRNHWKGQGCVKCYNDIRSSKLSSNNEDFIKKSKSIHGDKYDYSKVNYTNSKNIVEIICKKHGSFFKKPNNHINGDREGCPKCSYSYGESIIYSILKENNIKFITQKKFSGCKFKKSLRFDFYLPDYNTCIEYNGEQHYRSVDFYGGDEEYELRKIRDNIKNDYCLNNNINLLILKYGDDIISKIVEKLKVNLINSDFIYDKYISYEEAVFILKESKIKSQKEYYLSYKDINTNLPSHPHKIYKKDWINWSNYLSIEKQTLERDNMGRFKKKV